MTAYYDWSGIGQDWKDAAIFPVVPESEDCVGEGVHIAGRSGLAAGKPGGP